MDPVIRGVLGVVSRRQRVRLDGEAAAFTHVVPIVEDRDVLENDVVVLFDDVVDVRGNSLLDDVLARDLRL